MRGCCTAQKDLRLPCGTPDLKSQMEQVEERIKEARSLLWSGAVRDAASITEMFGRILDIVEAVAGFSGKRSKARAEREKEKPARQADKAPKERRLKSPRKDAKGLDLALDLEQSISQEIAKTPRASRDPQPQLSSPTPSEERIVEKWTNKKMAVIYDSRRDAFNARSLWRAIQGRREIGFFVQTKRGFLFGAYFSEVPPAQNTWTVDPKHFVFAIENGRVRPHANSPAGCQARGDGQGRVPDGLPGLGEEHAVRHQRVCDPHEQQHKRLLRRGRRPVHGQVHRLPWGRAAALPRGRESVWNHQVLGRRVQVSVFGEG